VTEGISPRFDRNCWNHSSRIRTFAETFGYVNAKTNNNFQSSINIFTYRQQTNSFSIENKEISINFIGSNSQSNEYERENLFLSSLNNHIVFYFSDG